MHVTELRIAIRCELGMIVAIDESGSFASNSTDRHFFAAIHLRQRKSLYEIKRRQFSAWETGLPRSIKNATGERKSSALSDRQLADFARQVIRSQPYVRITPYAIRPAENPATIVEKHRAVVVMGINRGRKMYGEQGKVALARTLDESAHWVKKLNYSQFVKIVVLGNCLFAAFVNSIGHSISGGYDDELPDLRFLVDRDFIREPRHNLFWLEVILRNLICNASENNPIPVLDEWEEQNHPFLAKYLRDGEFDFKELFWSRCAFVSSHQHFEIRIADAVNTILSRALNERGCNEAFRFISDCFCGDRRVHQLILNDVDLRADRSDVS
jgi:hypothetical protein